jgi:hypothetical protein
LRQARFGVFLQQYNHERSYQALGMTVPADLYTPSRFLLGERIAKCESAHQIDFERPEAVERNRQRHVDTEASVGLPRRGGESYKEVVKLTFFYGRR